MVATLISISKHLFGDHKVKSLSRAPALSLNQREKQPQLWIGSLNKCFNWKNIGISASDFCYLSSSYLPLQIVREDGDFFG